MARCTLFWATVMLALVPFLNGCSKEQEKSAPATENAAAKPESPPSPASAPAAAKGTGAIAGRIVYKGTYKPDTLPVGRDKEVCGNSKTDPTLVVGAGSGVKNAVVQIDGLREGKSPVKEVVLDQVKCEYSPHVLVMPSGGTVRIKNSDGILHNVHTLSKINTPFNRAQPKFVKEISESFVKAEFVPVRCDVHGWMSGWIVVTDNVFFAVSGPDGGFEMTGVPAGKRTLEVWHESLGKSALTVEVKPGETVTVSFEFQPKN